VRPVLVALTVAALSAALAVAAAPGAAPGAGAPDGGDVPARATRHVRVAHDITVGDNFFVRERGTPTVTVRRGDTVAFRFRGDSPHNVVVTRGPRRFRSPVRVSGTYRRSMATAGSYTIVCTIHGAADQRMTLRVR
jgi:plastocyanin